MFFYVIFVARGELTALFSCLHAPPKRGVLQWSRLAVPAHALQWVLVGSLCRLMTLVSQAAPGRRAVFISLSALLRATVPSDPRLTVSDRGCSSGSSLSAMLEHRIRCMSAWNVLVHASVSCLL
jgi:hypothetical protein